MANWANVGMRFVEGVENFDKSKNFAAAREICKENGLVEVFWGGSGNTPRVLYGAGADGHLEATDRGPSGVLSL